jgi:hypothetical protein
MIRGGVAIGVLVLLSCGAGRADDRQSPPSNAPFAAQLRTGSVLLGTNARFASRIGFGFSENLLRFSQAEDAPPGALLERAGIPDPGVSGIETLDNQSTITQPPPSGTVPAPHAARPWNAPKLKTVFFAGCPSLAYRADAETPYWSALAADAAWSTGRNSPVDQRDPAESNAMPVTEAVSELRLHALPSEWCPPGGVVMSETSPFPILLWGPLGLFLIGALVFYAVRGLRRP